MIGSRGWCDGVIPGEVDGFVLGTTSDNLLPDGIIPLDHDFHSFAYVFLIVGSLNLALAVEEDLQAGCLFSVWDGVDHDQGRSVGARGVFEAEDGIVLDGIEEGDGLFKFQGGFTGKAHDEVGGDGDRPFGGLDPGDAFEVPVAGVLAGHLAQDAGRAGLYGQVDVVAEGGYGVDDFDDVAGEVSGVAGGESDATDAGNLADGSEQLGEGTRALGVAVAVDILAEELDFGVAAVGDAACLFENGVGASAALLAACVGDDAVGAELVAAFDDGDVGAVRIFPGGELGFKGLVSLAVVESGDAGFSCFKAGEHLGEFAVGGGASDERDVGRAVEDFFAFLLGDTAEDGEALPFPRELLVVVESVEDLLLGFVADGAGVVEEQVCVQLSLDLGVSLLFEGADDLFGVMCVHLAAEGLEIECFCVCHPVTSICGKPSVGSGAEKCEQSLHLVLGEATGEAGHFAFSVEDDAADSEVGCGGAVGEFVAQKNAANVWWSGLEGEVIFAVAVFAADVVEVLSLDLLTGERRAVVATQQKNGGCGCGAEQAGNPVFAALSCPVHGFIL